MGPVSFLTPLASLVALAGLLPLLALIRRERHARRVREKLGLEARASGPHRSFVAALIAVPALAGIAAAQPVVDRSEPLRERVDAEIFFVLDTSRSMLAASGPDEPTRFDRARSGAIAIRARLGGFRAGIGEMTDLVVPHLFPTVDAPTFDSTLTRSVYVGALGARQAGVFGTSLSALAAVTRGNHFTPGTEKRLLIVLTDGESAELEPRLARLSQAGIRTIFVHVWRPRESIWRPEGAEPEYRPDPASAQLLVRAAALADGSVFDEDDLSGIVARARAELGRGPTRRREQRDLLALMPYATLAAALPLGLVLRRRNL